MDVGDLYRQSVIPTAANNPGRFGAHYKTRVVIFNPTERDYSITARLYGTTGLVRWEEIPMDAETYRVWDNFLEDVFDYRGGGGIWLTERDGRGLYGLAERSLQHHSAVFSEEAVRSTGGKKIPILCDGRGLYGLAERSASAPQFVNGRLSGILRRIRGRDQCFGLAESNEEEDRVLCDGRGLYGLLPNGRFSTTVVNGIFPVFSRALFHQDTSPTTMLEYPY